MAVVIDLTAIRDGTGPARLSDMVEAAPRGHSRPGSLTRPRRGAPEVDLEVLSRVGNCQFGVMSTRQQRRRWVSRGLP